MRGLQNFLSRMRRRKEGDEKGVEWIGRHIPFALVQQCGGLNSQTEDEGVRQAVDYC